jgi:acid stress-induced BolA-like protein IbaG/YrbA
MMQPEQVEKIIAAGLSCEHLQVAGDGHHFEALIVSAEFVGKQSRATAAAGKRSPAPTFQ